MKQNTQNGLNAPRLVAWEYNQERARMANKLNHDSVTQINVQVKFNYNYL
jgi:hypothetical protein